jgi:hypothetical protein
VEHHAGFAVETLRSFPRSDRRYYFLTIFPRIGANRL